MLFRLACGAAVLVGRATSEVSAPSAAGEILDDLTGNLLVNGGPEEASMAGWEDVVNGGDGWDAHVGDVDACETDEDADDCDANFKTSYQACTRSQTVSLVVEGKVDGDLLDSGTVAILVSEEVREFYDVDKFFIKARLCADEACKKVVSVWDPCEGVSKVATEESYRWCETQGKPEDIWRNHSYVFGGAEVAKGARYLKFEDGGVDSEYWTGWWGPWFRNAHVAVHASRHSFAPTVTPQPTPKPVPSASPTAAPSGEPAPYDPYSPGDYAYEYAYFSPDGGGDPTPTPRPVAAGGGAPPAASKTKPGAYVVAFGAFAVVAGFGLGYIVRCRKQEEPANPYAIAGTQLEDEDDDGLEMRGRMV